MALRSIWAMGGGASGAAGVSGEVGRRGFVRARGSDVLERQGGGLNQQEDEKQANCTGLQGVVTGAAARGFQAWRPSAPRPPPGRKKQF